jgi:hypothetical protein
LAGTVRVKGLRELDRALRKMDKELSREMRSTLKEAAEIVAVDARARFSDISPASASSMRARAKAKGATVEQSKGRTTGKRPDYGALQMRRALLPALEAKQEQVVEKVDDLIGRLGSRNGF